MPSYRNKRTRLDVDAAVHLITTSAIRVPAATPVITVPTFVGAVRLASAVAIETDDNRGVVAKAGEVAISGNCSRERC